MKKKIVQTAFTLAEVLITLGIIGVVASLTMPALIANHRKIVVETHLKRFYSNMNQAIKLSEVDNGDKKEWAFTGDIDWYNKYLAPYLKTTSIQYKDASLIIKFIDGSSDIISYYGHDHTYCLNSKQQKYGTNCFTFGFYPTYTIFNKHHYDKGVEPYIRNDWDGTYEDLPRVNGYTRMIQLNNWKIPDDYPLKF
ncbi:MAG: type II secretion system GspH family protein [Heliobacteriaceae bacterium]|jgi:prepilin-type N-terminal cleavage/methylation domain-containing protein|nr:type II secretion system GspH family protein [Heliobacteriaceae bacterium]